MPFPPSDGGAQAIHNTTRGLLDNNIDVTVMAINPSRNYVSVDQLPQEYLLSTKFKSVFVDTGIKPWRIFMNMFKKESYFIERFKSKDVEIQLIELLSKSSFDIIQFEHLYMLLYLDLVKQHSNAKLIFRPQNVETVIWQRYLKSVRNRVKKQFFKFTTARLETFEKLIVGKVDGIIALTEDDAKVFRTFSEDVPIIAIPMGFDFDKLEGYNFDEQYVRFPIFYHLGSMDWLPNEEAMQWFVDQVLDRVVEKIPKVKIHIAGRNMQDCFYQRKSNNLIVEGEIKNPIEYQKDKAIMIVPLLSGSGIRAKIVEGIALGKTIITTTIGAQGINYTHGVNLLIADTPDEFAQQMITCYQSLDYCKNIGNNARELSKAQYHHRAIAKEMIDFYKIMIDRK
jgi:glycosyltransferase involved in cell wall biosynthesis